MITNAIPVTGGNKCLSNANDNKNYCETTLPEASIAKENFSPAFCETALHGV